MISAEQIEAARILVALRGGDCGGRFERWPVFTALICEALHILFSVDVLDDLSVVVSHRSVSITGTPKWCDSTDLVPALVSLFPQAARQYGFFVPTPEIGR